MLKEVLSFRPLSRGLFFNVTTAILVPLDGAKFSSPFLGTFFQYFCVAYTNVKNRLMFSSPFSGTFFQCVELNPDSMINTIVFVPFLGDFFSIMKIP